MEFNHTVNAVNLLGVVAESKLKLAEGTNNETRQKYNYINGSLVIKCGDNREVNLKVFVKEFTNAGKENKKYATLFDLVPDSEGHTVAPTLANASEEEATKVSVWGNNGYNAVLKDNFYVKDGEVVESIDLDLAVGTITIKDNHKVSSDDYKAEFEVKAYVHDVQEEEVDGAGTGRAKVKSYVPFKNGTVMPITIYAGVVSGVERDGTPYEYDFGADVLSLLQPSDTVTFWGDINFLKITTQVQRGGEGRQLGRAKVDTKTTTVKEFVATGATLIEDYEKSFETEDIKEAVKQRAIAIDNKKKEEESKGSNESKGHGGNFGARKSPVGGASTSSPRPAGRPAF